MSYQDPRLPSRPPSEQLVDLHVYVVPGDVWVEHLRLVYNEAVKDTVSAGFVRVFPDVTIYNLREEIEEQLGYDVIPKEFIFLRGVGRALTQVKGRQEFQLKVKNFVPPLASSPEIYVIEGSLVHQSPRALPAIGHRYSEPGTSRSTASDNPLDRSQVFSDPPPGRSHSQRRKDFEPLRKSDEYDSQRTDHDRLGNHGRRRDDHREAFVTQADAARQKVHKLDRSRAGSRAATYTSQTNEDSGIADSTPPEEDNRTLDRRKREEERQRREAEERRREEEDRREEEERRHREEEERWRRQREKEAQSKKGRSRSNSPEHQVARFPSPPPLELPSSRDGGKTQTSESPKKSTRSKRRSSGAGADREDLLEELERIREERKNAEKKREEMVKKAKQLQNKTQHRRNQARDIWKKRYFEEKKKTTPLEENCNRLRAELDMTHRKLMSKLEGDKDGKRRFNVNTDPPSSKNNQKVQLTRIQHELDDLKEKVENAKMKLTSEMKLRNQAETELRALRAELTQKKIHAALTRNQQSNIMHTMDKVQPGYMPAKVMPPT
ncbi:spermatogenesis-associated protein 1-like isoform X6 [Branchiostoma floridae x Branchiostoma japonicum]